MKPHKTKEIDVDYYTVNIDKESQFYDSGNQVMISYWTDKKRIYWRYNIIKEADLETFVVFNNIFAKDKKHCYLYGRKLQGANPKTFTVLNNCYAKDDTFAWTLGGKIKDIDAQTFQVCDDGINKSSVSLSDITFKDGTKGKIKIEIPYGYAKDKNQVYYENFQGKAKILKKANPETFVSLNNGLYGLDDKYVFYGKNIIQKANPKTWKLIDFNKYTGYSKDDKNIFCFHKIVKEADSETFELQSYKTMRGSIFYHGKDKNHYFYHEKIATMEEIKAYIEGNPSDFVL